MLKHDHFGHAADEKPPSAPIQPSQSAAEQSRQNKTAPARRANEYVDVATSPTGLFQIGYVIEAAVVARA